MKKQNTEEKDRNIQWHAGSYGATMLEFREDNHNLEYEKEYLLNPASIKIDLIIRKKIDCVIKNEIGHLFKVYNIVEYKNPNDALNINVYLKVISYVGLFLSYNNISTKDVTITYLRETLPKKLLNELSTMGLIVKEKYAGIYYIQGDIIFPNQQIVVSERLDSKNHVFLKALSKKLTLQGAKRFISEAQNLKTPSERNNLDAVLEVSMAANRKIYNLIRKEQNMCNALREFFKEEIDEINRKADEKLKQAKAETTKAKAETTKAKAEIIKLKEKAKEKDLQLVELKRQLAELKAKDKTKKVA